MDKIESFIKLFKTPGGIIPFNNLFTNRFGILAFEVSQALLPDASILSVLYEDYKSEYFNMIAQSIKYKLGFSIDCFSIANIQFDWLRAQEEKRLIYTTLDTNFIDKKKLMYNDLKTPVYNILNMDDTLKMSCFLHKKLSGYGHAVCI